jgi:hypothetical protein
MQKTCESEISVAKKISTKNVNRNISAHVFLFFKMIERDYKLNFNPTTTERGKDGPYM